MIRALVAESRDFSPVALDVLSSLANPDLCELNRSQLLARIGDYEILWVRLGIAIDCEVLDAAARLKVIVSPTTGLDHIDLGRASKNGVAVLSLQGEQEFLASIPATAELTWGLLLSLTRRIPWASSAVNRGEWDRTRFRGHDLRGQTLGIVGLGRLGIQVARFGLAFGMKVCAYDPYRATWPAEVNKHDSLDELLGRSHVVSVHVPLNSGTVGLIGQRELLLMQPGSVLLNTSRGSIVDPSALIDVLASGHLAGAALDVVPDELEAGSIHRRRLIEYAARHEHLLITPHIGGATFESMAATEIFMANKLRDFFDRNVMLRVAG